MILSNKQGHLLLITSMLYMVIYNVYECAYHELTSHAKCCKWVSQPQSSGVHLICSCSSQFHILLSIEVPRLLTLTKIVVYCSSYNVNIQKQAFPTYATFLICLCQLTGRSTGVTVDTLERPRYITITPHMGRHSLNR